MSNELQVLKTTTSIRDKFFFRDGKYWITSVQLAHELGYMSTRQMNTMYNRNIVEFEPFVGYINLIYPRGNAQNTLCFDEHGAYIAGMLAKTITAKIFRQQLAALLLVINHSTTNAASLTGNAESLQKNIAKLRQEEAVYTLRRYLRFNRSGITAQKINRMKKLLSVLTASEISLIYGMSTCNIKKILRLERRSHGDFENKMPKSLLLCRAQQVQERLDRE